LALGSAQKQARIEVAGQRACTAQYVINSLHLSQVLRHIAVAALAKIQQLKLVYSLHCPQAEFCRMPAHLPGLLHPFPHTSLDHTMEGCGIVSGTTLHNGWGCSEILWTVEAKAFAY
jgi:hypothetical protein